MIALLNIRATEIILVNNIVEEGEISIETIHDFGVDFSGDEKNCVAHISLGFRAKNDPKTLNITCKMIAEFATDEITADEEKKRAHIECYDNVFPYAQSLVARICAEAGLPPFYCSKIVMNRDNIAVK